eukprot:scaffold8161_cov111-Cylindrotheca_fusiformis.AAC.4
MLSCAVLFSILIICGLLPTIESFLLPNKVSLRPEQPLPRSLLLAFQQDDESTEAIQRRLVEYGMAWKQATITPEMTKVPGCVSTVYILAKEEEEEEESNKKTIHITGNSDAIVSRGLLSLLNEYLVHNASSKEEILALDPKTIADQLNVRKALTTGRNDGLSNMLQVIQQQLRWRGEEEEEAIRNNDETTTAFKSSISSKNNKRVALLLSGGVDSSVALRLLLNDGYDVTAFYLKIWLEDELAHLGECPWEDDVHICEQVCQQQQQPAVPLEIISLQEQYHERVMQHTLQEASQGRTPNPDILCNSRVKFGCFLEYLDSDRKGEFDFIASGHYAQLQRSSEEGPVRLVRAPDPIKDQSYFLCALQQHQLKKLLFPIGHLEKYQVRELADEFQLPNRNRPDSQGLCFLGKVKFSDFLNSHLGVKQGDIVDAFTGDIIGQHQGVWYHTVGQRKGIGNSLFPVVTSRGPWYVVAKDTKKNIVFASNQYDEEVFTKARSEFHVENIQWIAGHPPAPSFDSKYHQLDMKIRHGPRLVTGNLELRSDDDGIIQLVEKDGGLAPGQYVVFYDSGDANCLGGGIISERHWAKFLLDAEERQLVEESTTTSKLASS